MRLRYLSQSITILCLAGLILIAGFGYVVINDLRQARVDTDRLLSLQQRVDMLSMVSESMLLFEPDAALLDALKSEGQALQAAFRELEQNHPGAMRMGRYIDLTLELVEVEQARALAGQSGPGEGMLGLDQRSRDILSQLAGHNMALHSALAGMIRERQAVAAEQGNVAVSALAVSASFFALLCVMAFMTLHRRLGQPVNHLTDVIRRLEGGERTARARLPGRDEMAKLADAFNHLLDRQQATEQELRDYEESLEQSHRWLAESQQIAHVGSLRLHIPTEHLAWSEESFRIFGLDPSTWSGAPQDFIRLIHGDDYADFVRKRSKALAGEGDLDVEYRITRPDGAQRHIRQRAIVRRDANGEPEYLVGTLQDITDQRVTAHALAEQQRLLEMAGRLARFGSWSVDVAEARVYWSEVVCEIFEVPHGTRFSVDEGIAYYAPEYQDIIARRYENCVFGGEPFDEELEVITAKGRRIWVRATGEAVYDRSGVVVTVQGALQDISDFKRAQKRAAQLGHRFQSVLENLNEAFFTLDENWRFSYLNTEAIRLLQKPASSLLGCRIWDVYPDLEKGPVGDIYRYCMAHQVPRRVNDFFYEPLDAWFDIRAYAFEGGLSVFFEDVSERHRLISRLQAQEQDLRASRDELAEGLALRKVLINSLPAHIALLDGKGFIRDVNDYWRRFAEDNGLDAQRHGLGINYLEACERAEGEGADDARRIAAALREVLDGARPSFFMEYPCHSPSEERWFRVMVNRLASEADGVTGTGAVVMHLDITERKQAERELNRLAFEDPLAPVLSRTGFTRALDETMVARGWDEQGMVVMLDILSLRHVNDAHGYAVGDELIRLLGERLMRLTGETGFAGRAGGDEFMVYLASRKGESKQQRRRALERIVQEPFAVHGFTIEVQARYGYTQFRKVSRSAEALLREAELALFQGAGREHGQHWSAYTEALDRETRSRVGMAKDLRRALERDEFTLNFQPKVDMRTGQVVAAEALLRWQHPEQGPVSPAEFIPVAEQSQLIRPIGEWVLAEACRTAAQWQASGLEDVRIAVNVSLQQFSDQRFSRKVSTFLRTHGIRPDALSLEITESVFESEGHLLGEQMAELTDMGIRLSLDDFGTGYSSLLYIQKYPFDEIKIDRGFVSHMLREHYSHEIVRTVIGVAGLIGADVVAEGVETAEERDALLAMGCHIAQGYFYSRPLPARDFQSLLESASAPFATL
ncbi:EAL domain-containing protein [Natronospira bacteriovora]|uniref:EAL domain-containing protein n=1 Tax=Natronospira bacteriovora TaxID=3069753 RepID=A0ABU0W967_9GAMM|nr:EAL domain-containing protein [Natronospira sp. AB-CW4]MDQ2070502.1 EAL domain-containing protein [Natronospira sp. AB-CW4]